MAAKVSNNAFGTLSTSITTSSTTITLTAGQGARFPALGAGDYFYATLVDTANNIEIIKATARSVDSLTVVRAQDGTTAKAYAINDRLELRPVAALFNEKVDLETVTTVARGGTGRPTLTTGSILAGNGTAQVNEIAPGTSGNVLTSNGSAWQSSALPAGGFSNMQVFTASGTFTIPAGITKVKVTVVGGGGNGANAQGSYNVSIGSFGGGGGGASIKVVTGLISGNTVSVTVGGAGATSSFGAFCSATGGGTPLGGLGASGDINISGGGGEGGSTSAGGAGGSSILGGGAASVQLTDTRRVGGQYGGGGSGGFANSATVRSGGAGTAGVVIIEF